MSQMRDWSVHFRHHYEIARNPQQMHYVDVQEPFNSNDMMVYRMWFERACMHSVYLKKKHAETLQEVLPTPTVDQSQRGHLSSGPKETCKVKSMSITTYVKSFVNSYASKSFCSFCELSGVLLTAFSA